MKRDFVAAYDFQAPEAKREMALSNYLARMEKHRYENARIDEVVAVKGNDAYVRASVLWTPIDEMTRKVKLEPGQTLTQSLTMIETWRFADGDWVYVRPQIDTEFFEDHPELLRGDAQAPEKAADLKPAGTDQAGAEKSGAEKSGAEKSGAEKSGAEKSGAEKH